MYLAYYEEGDVCPKCRKGIIDWPPVENCSCHIDPPCSACTSRLLACPKCGWEDERPDYKYVIIAPGLSMRENAPRPLDNSKIDYRVKMHTHFSMIKEGVYPEGTSREEVESVVRGTFGGRFELFENGKFRYIAYTD